MRSTTTPALSTSLDRLQLELFETMCTQEKPLTLKQIMRLTQLPETDLQQAIDVLRSLCLVTRLNTIIDSYTVVSCRGADPSMRAGARPAQAQARTLQASR